MMGAFVGFLLGMIFPWFTAAMGVVIGAVAGTALGFGLDRLASGKDKGDD